MIPQNISKLPVTIKDRSAEIGFFMLGVPFG